MQNKVRQLPELSENVLQESIADNFKPLGRVWLRDAINSEDLLKLDRIVGNNESPGDRVGPSDLLTDALGPESSVTRAIRNVLPDAAPVRVVSFSKSKMNNWAIPWHQDRVIAVKERHEVRGYSNWTKKGQFWHCEPPISVLEQMLFVRIHLDEANDSNGTMKIAVGSHKLGLVKGSSASTLAGKFRIESTTARRGDILALNMLTLHCSPGAILGRNRRVIRVDYANFKLPEPLEWAYRR